MARRLSRRRELVDRVTITGPNALRRRALETVPAGWRVVYLNPQVRGGRVLDRFRLVVERVRSDHDGRAGS